MNLRALRAGLDDSSASLHQRIIPPMLRHSIAPLVVMLQGDLRVPHLACVTSQPVLGVCSQVVKEGVPFHGSESTLEHCLTREGHSMLDDGRDGAQVDMPHGCGIIHVGVRAQYGHVPVRGFKTVKARANEGVDLPIGVQLDPPMRMKLALALGSIFMPPQHQFSAGQAARGVVIDQAMEWKHTEVEHQAFFVIEGGTAQLVLTVPCVGGVQVTAEEPGGVDRHLALGSDRIAIEHAH